MSAKASSHLRAAAVLDALARNGDAPWWARPVTYEVSETSLAIGSGEEHIIARRYFPRDGARGPALVLLHGIHRLGMDEPRLVHLARALAAVGADVLTPEIAELSDYRIDPKSIASIGASASAFSQMTGRPVGVIGMSFAGGLALLAKADARYAPAISCVLAVGAHDDLARVARFFLDDEIVGPDGDVQRIKAHEYGLTVLVYGHTEAFFPPTDAPIAHEAIRLWLWEQRDGARSLERDMSSPSRHKLEQLFSHDVAAFAPEVTAVLDRSQKSMRSVSPHGNMLEVHGPVFLLHGAGDSVIPATETRWLAHDLAPHALGGSLVSPAIVHVEMQAEPTVTDRLRLVHLLADVIEAAR